jgi:cytochrome c
VRRLLLHPWVSIAALATLVAVSSITVHPFGAPKQFQAQKASIDDLKLPAEITTIFRRSCADCHSSQTAWPWYSYVAPVSWLVERDVRRGRDHMNLSEWQQYTMHKRQKLLADVASAVKNGEMPLAQYTLIHRHAKLSEAERDLVYQWARKERRRLRAESQSPATGDNATREPLQPAVASEATH